MLVVCYGNAQTVQRTSSTSRSASVRMDAAIGELREMAVHGCMMSHQKRRQEMNRAEKVKNNLLQEQVSDEETKKQVGGEGW